MITFFIFHFADVSQISPGIKIDNINASSFFTTKFSNIFAKVLELPTNRLEVQYNESSGEFLVNARSLSSSQKNEVLDKMKDSSFITLIQKEISEDKELKELKVKNSSQPSIKPVLSKLTYPT